jgi:hypothetical protein
MKTFKTGGVYTTAIALLAVMLFIFVGCSENPLGADNSSEPRLLMRSANFLSTTGFEGDTYHADTVFVAKEGGVLQLLDVTLEVPPDAVANDTLFSIDIPDIAVFYNEFGTSGLVFQRPVKVTMSYRGADLSGVNESTIRIGWYNPRTGSFQNVDCEIDFANKTVTGYLNHFSAYALISDEQ